MPKFISGDVRKTEPVLQTIEDIKVTMSIGVAIFPSQAKIKKDLKKLSNKAVYWFKEHGRNTFSLFDEIKKEA